MVIWSADDWVCFLSFVVWTRHPAQGATGGRLMPGLVLTWFPLWEFSLCTMPRVSSLVVSGPGASAPSPKAQGLISGLLLLAAPHFSWKECKSDDLTSGLAHPPGVQHSDVLLCKSSGIIFSWGPFEEPWFRPRLRSWKDRTGAGIGNPQPRGL